MKLYVDGEQLLTSYGIKFISGLSAAFLTCVGAGSHQTRHCNLVGLFHNAGSPQTLNTGLLPHHCLKRLLHFTVHPNLNG